MLLTAKTMFTLICGATYGAETTSRWPRERIVLHANDALSGV